MTREGKVALVLAVLGLAVGALGEDVFDPPWDMALPNQTEQEWIAWRPIPGDPEPIPSGTSLPPELFNNEYGTPVLTFTSPDWEIREEIGWEGLPITTWHYDGQPGTYGTIEIKIKNNPEENLYKLIFWQVTSDGSPTPTGDPPQTDPPSSVQPTGMPHHKWDDNWYTYNGMLKIVPNPAEETIIFQFAPSTDVAQIVINTVCMPEPATLALLAMGGLALIRRRRR